MKKTTQRIEAIERILSAKLESEVSIRVLKETIRVDSVAFVSLLHYERQRLLDIQSIHEQAELANESKDNSHFKSSAKWNEYTKQLKGWQ